MPWIREEVKYTTVNVLIVSSPYSGLEYNACIFSKLAILMAFAIVNPVMCSSLYS